MQFLFPWALLSLLAVVAAAFIALARPMQKVMPVGSLRLWEQAVAALGPAACKSRRISVAWWLMLCGAALAAIAPARPTYYSESPARRIDVAIYPSAELAGLSQGQAALPDVTDAFLRRLAPTDRVRLILPVTMGGAGEVMTPDDARRRIAEMRLLPTRADDLSVPPGDGDADHTYRFAPATLKFEDGPGITTVFLPAIPADVTIDAFAVTPQPGENAQVFVAVRNHTKSSKKGEVIIAGNSVAEGRGASASVTFKYDLKPGGRGTMISQLPPGCDYCFAAITARRGRGLSAYCARRRALRANVAIIGRSDPLVRRFVQKNPALRLIDDPARADAVIAIGVDAPAGIPAMIIDPPDAPEGWSDGDVLKNVALRDAGVLADHPVLAHVDLSDVALRRVKGWRAVDMPEQRRLVSIGDDALILAGTNPPRIYLAFDTAVENTNFAMTESFVIFMTNAFKKYLSPQSRAEVSWDSVSPILAGLRRDWKPLVPPATDGLPLTVVGDDPLPQPGLYSDESGEIHAVSLTGLRSAEPDVSPLKRVSEITLPQPGPMTRGFELWPILAIAAAALWMAGWISRMK